MKCFKKFILILVFAVLFTAIATGCGGEADKNGGSNAPSTSMEQTKDGADSNTENNTDNDDTGEKDSVDKNGGNWTVVVPGRK